MTKKLCGYTGKGLRINLTTREVKVEATFPRFKDDIGGTAIGYKVFWEEVDPKTSCYDPENKLVIAPGPLHGCHLLGPHGHHDALADGLSSVAHCERPRRRRTGS